MRLRGVVTAFSGWKNSFFLQDESGGISIDRAEQTRLNLGDRVVVSGTVQPGRFAPIMMSSQIDKVASGSLPPARTVTYDELLTGTLDSQFVEVKGVVQAAKLDDIWGRSVLLLQLRMSGGRITVHVLNYPGQSFSRLVDATVRIRGVCGSVFNGRRQLVGVRLFVSDLKQVNVQGEAAALSRLPVTPLDSLLNFNPDGPRIHRIRTTGVVTYQLPGQLLYLQDKASGIRVETDQQTVFAPGTKVQVFGFVGSGGYTPGLDNAFVTRLAEGPEPAPVSVEATGMIKSIDGFATAPYDGLLVHVEGKLVERLPHAGGQLWLLEKDHVPFQAELGEAGQRSQIEPGSLVGLTGICRVEMDDRRNPVSFQILLRSRKDVSVLRSGAATGQVPFLGIALGFVLAVAVFIWFLSQRNFETASKQDTGILNSHIALASDLSRRIALPIAGFGLLVLTNLAIRAGFSKEILPAYLVVNPAVGAALALGGISLLLVSADGRRRRDLAAGSCAVLTAAIGALAFIHALSGWLPGLDWLLFSEAGTLTSVSGSGSMALTTSVVLIFLGIALLLLPHKRSTWVAQAAALLAGSLCVLALNSYVYGIHDFPGIAAYAAIGFKTASCLFLLSLSILFRYSERGPMHAISSRSPGGAMARSLLPCALLAPSIIGWVRWQIQLLGLYDTSFGLALFTSANAICFTSLIWSSAWLLNRLDSSRSAAEKGTRESEERYRTAVESLPQLVWTCQADGQCDFVSRRWAEYTGKAEAESLGQGWSRHLHADDRAGTFEKWEASLQSGSRFDIEYRLRSAAGEYRWFRAMGVPLHDQGGHVTRWFGTCTDVEDYKRAKAEILRFNETLEAMVAERTAALRDSEERYRFIIEGVQDYSITAFDREGNLTSWNSGAQRQTGYSTDEVVGKHFSMFYVAADKEANMPALDLAAAQREGESHRERLHLRKVGSEFWADVLITIAWNEDGSVRGYSKISRDISERKRAEQMLQIRHAQLADINGELTVQRQRAEAAAKAKSDFLAAMSHEIRTPMNAILAMAEILQNSDLDAEQKQYVEVFRRNGRALLALINDILDFSKIESGQLELESIPFELARLINHGTELARVEASAKGILLSSEIGAGVPGFLKGDPTRLRQILINLLSNALKFTAQGRITVSVSLADGEDRSLIQFDVTDTGIGIPEDKRSHIFEEFTQADSTTTRKFGGTGLGLSICRRLAERMGGRIWLTSVPEKGSTFSFTARLEASNAGSIPEDDLPARLSTESTERPLRILVAEDKEDNRLVVRLYLKGSPHTLQFANDGQEALQAFSAGQYDLILMDLQMPVLDGFSCTLAIRGLEKERNVKPTPIVALSADAGSSDRDRCLAAGFTDHFSKPISMAKFLSLIRKYSNPGMSISEAEGLSSSERVAAAFRKRAPKYLAQRRTDADEIVRLAAASDFEQIYSIAHNLKGSGTTFGYPDLTRLGAALESAAEVRDRDAIRSHSLELSRFIEDAVEALQSAA